MFPHQRPPAWIKAVTNYYLLWQMPSGNRQVYLTFDDGPHPEITTRVLNLLQTYNARATFFVLGEKALQHKELVHTMLQKGHGLGSHGWSHLDGWTTPRHLYMQNIDKLGVMYPMRLFRPPFGRITPGQALDLKRQKIRTVMWTVSTLDYDSRYNATSSLDFLKRKITDGSIILMHDSKEAESSLFRILPGLLDFLIQAGYDFPLLPDAFVLNDLPIEAKN